jgi:hypothetical protein
MNHCFGRENISTVVGLIKANSDYRLQDGD